jgi:flagellar basal-body rod modification protein FlgD
MAISIDSTTSTSTAAQAAVDQASLDSEAFLQLFLVELQHQDPTEPMDNAQMLEQTSQLATLQAQEQQQAAMESITETLATQAQYQAQFSILTAIGHEAVTNLNALQHDGASSSSFEMYFENPIKGGTINIMDEDSENLVKEIAIPDDLIGKSGYQTISWDGTNNDSVMQNAGVYAVSGEYVDQDDNKIAITLGTGKVESVRYDAGTPYLKMGSTYVGLDSIEEIR